MGAKPIRADVTVARLLCKQQGQFGQIYWDMPVGEVLQNVTNVGQKVQTNGHRMLQGWPRKSRVLLTYFSGP